MASDFHVNFVSDGNVLTIRPEGHMDAVTSPELDKRIHKTLTNEFTTVILDLEKVEYVSSAGLRVILALEEDLEERNASLKVTNINEMVMDIFDLAGFTDFLDMDT